MNRRNNPLWRDFKHYCKIKDPVEKFRFLTEMLIRYNIPTYVEDEQP